MRFGFNYGVGKGSGRYRNSFLISYLMDTVYTDGAMDRFLDNVGANGSNNDAVANASNHIFLNGTTQSIPYPVLHTLGTDDKKIATSVGTGWTDNANNTYTGSTASSDITGLTTLTSGVVNVTITLSSVTAGDVNGYDADGTYVFEETLTAALNLTGTGFTGIVSVDSIKEITLPSASYLTILQADGTIKQLSSTGDVGELLFEDDFSDGNTTGWSALNDALLTVESGRMKVAYNGTGNAFARRDLSGLVTNGKTYTFRGDTKAEGEATGNCRIDYRFTTSDLANNGDDGIHTGIPDGSLVPRIDCYNLGTVGHSYFDNFKLRESLPISTTYSVTDSHQFTFNHTSPLSAADKAAIEADPNLAFRMFFDGEVLPSGFSRANDMVDCNFFGGNEGLLSAEKVYDLSDQTFLTYVSIVAYDTATRTTLANQSNGATGLKLIKDGSGRTTGVVTDNTTRWYSGDNAPSGWTVAAPYTITEIIGADTYTFTSDLNRYKNGIADGTFTAPVGVWTLGELAFDGVTPTPSRGKTDFIDAVVIP